MDVLFDKALACDCRNGDGFARY